MAVRGRIVGVGVVFRGSCGATALGRVIRVGPGCEMSLDIVHGSRRAAGRSGRKSAKGCGVGSLVQKAHRRRHSTVLRPDVHAREIHVEVQVEQLVGIQRDVGELRVDLFVVEGLRVG